MSTEALLRRGPGVPCDKVHPGQSDLFRPGKSFSEQNIGNNLVTSTWSTSSSCLQELLGTWWIYCWLWPATCSLLSPLCSIFVLILETPVDLYAGGNNLSSPLSSQSKLMSLVVAATIIRLNFGFGSGGVIQETHVCSLTGADWCHLVLPEL